MKVEVLVDFLTLGTLIRYSRDLTYLVSQEWLLFSYAKVTMLTSEEEAGLCFDCHCHVHSDLKIAHAVDPWPRGVGNVVEHGCCDRLR